jgi:glycosyltransferase involved in cell wall biosynthesis
MKKLKILQINKFYYLKGGSERSLFDVSEILKNKGHEVIPFSMTDSRNLSTKYSQYFIEKTDYDKFSLKKIINIFWNFEANKKLEKLIKETKPDIVHLHNIAHQLSPSIIRVIKKHNLPIVQTLHDYKLICPNYKLYSNSCCFKCEKGKYYRCFLRKCHKNSYLKSLIVALEAYFHKFLKLYDQVDLFIAPSEYMKKISIKFGIPEDKIEVLRHSIDKKYFKKEARPGDYLLYFGRLSKEKGIDVLLDALSLSTSKVKLKIVGAGEESKNLKLKSEKLKLENRVEFLGPKYSDDLIKLIEEAKAIIMPSVWPENMPYSLLEAMAMKKPVIASRIGGMTEMIEDKKNGFLFFAGDPQGLKDIIDNLNNFDLKEIGEKAGEKVAYLKENYFYEKLIHIYRKGLRNSF